MLNRLDDAIDFALANGLIKRLKGGQLKHAPFTLSPYAIRLAESDQLIELTPVFNDLLSRVGNNADFLAEHLDQTILTDDFTRRLLHLLKKTKTTQPLQLLLSRGDFIFQAEKSGDGPYQAKQVEFNTIANSFPYMATQIHRLHRYLFAGHAEADNLIQNGSFSGYVEAMAEAIQSYDSPDSCLLMVIQPDESNIVDQRAIEYELLSQYGYPTLRMTLEEIADIAEIKEGHLRVGHYTCALTYFRAGYTPQDYLNEGAWRGREKIEVSSSIKCPTIGVQLAGTKKIQQVLSDPEILGLFVNSSSKRSILNTFVGLYAIESTKDDKNIREAVIENPSEYVLKPQREGGGNNLFGSEMIEYLRNQPEDVLNAFIIMEKIKAKTHPSILVVDGIPREVDCVSEIGRYGACFRNSDDLIFNRDTGYLVRTKASDILEGGVSAGFACLNSLTISH